jgi:2-keto-4-pentenoate hydratase/2-oxohepta-3-ene-1,7-dioic acid hydratase in catechol pathway
MKLVRYGEAGKEAPGLLDAQGVLRDASALVADWDGAAISPEKLEQVRSRGADALPVVGESPRLGCPIAKVGKIVCVGLNYADHAAETGAATPAEPVLFMKAVTAISGPNDAVQIPPGSSKVDWEVELGVVIGKRTTRVSEANALAHVAGYVLANDVSERAWQMERGGTWDKGKSHDTFAPLGPWLVTTDEVPDPHQLGLWLEVNGQRMQNGNTRNFIFGVPQVISYISQFMTLEAGDVVLTGTPAGVGLGQKPAPIFLKPGDVMRLGADGLGEQRQLCVAV